MKATKLLRFAIYLSCKRLKIFSHLIILILRYLFAFEAYVNENTKIGNDIQFKHNGLGCVSHPRVTIGANTRYMNGKLNNTGTPIIGKNTVIYSGAVVVVQ
ncbi:hypothetical protein UAW_00191 [Enterococcus haemoperoxidus ATCC BAA-382]|uniref:Serine acetyltransferase n=1 Tax=Enterococcus haemoperoxidus ATCC BAA-382 TaxID=1158608 RepID=R2TJ61_9ENTE|nr:hypothetical protein [Enterococcus haemoperoxidus]EOI00177.1 hypothetical protein UAW_00191 [Enterococcus haemoperoxidus ATCC BAA-382]EOT59585.1 hypothetical protein I583_02220 [Enterococcus haemoperoxidus ATCC BAA-382]